MIRQQINVNITFSKVNQDDFTLLEQLNGYCKDNCINRTAFVKKLIEEALKHRIERKFQA